MFCWDENEKKKGRITWWFLEGYTDMLERHPSVREGYARKRMYENLPVYINVEERIVGNLNWGVSKELFFNNVGNQILCKELVEELLGESPCGKSEPGISELGVSPCGVGECVVTGGYSEAERAEVKRRLALIEEHCLNDLDDRLPEKLQVMSKSSAGTSTYYNGHMVLDYEEILAVGLGGYRKRLKELWVKSETKEKREFYRGLCLALEGMQEYISRHGEMADAAYGKGMGGYAKQLGRICRRIAWEAPENLWEALQLSWFMFCFGDYDSYGRFDQYLYPFYEAERKRASVDGGMMDCEGEMKELFKTFLQKGEENRGILNMTIGGKNGDGSCAVNELTYLLMDVIRELGYKSPNLCLRVSAESEQRLYEKIHENHATGQAIPALYNDDVIIPMLLELGYPEEDANTYCLAGCSQVIFPGKSNMCCDVGMYNALKVLELTLHGGIDPLQKKLAGIGKIEEGVPEEVWKWLDGMGNFEELYAAYLEQMRYAIDCGVEINAFDIRARRDMTASVRTLFTQGCLESGKSIFQGGAVYNAVQNEIIGLTNVADSLLAIKKLVFDEKRWKLSQLVQMLDRDFDGAEKERAMLLAVPKFGNDIEEADEMRIRVGKDFYEELGKREGTLGGKQWPGEVIFQSHINLAPFTGASADGRRALTPLADSAGAMRGCDTEGPTSLISSFCKIPVTAPTVSRNLNIRFPKNVFRKEKGKIIDLFRVFMQLGGVQMQVNVLDQEELIKAKSNPEAYRDLVVRIGGYNDYFVEIPEKMQDEVIARTEQQL